MPATSSRRPGTDPNVFQFLNRSRLFKVGQHCLVLGNPFSIKLKSILRHFLERSFALLVEIFDMTRARQRLQRRCNHQLEVSLREYSIGVLPIHYLALLGDLYLARERALRLRDYGVMSWSTTAPDCSAASMKQSELYVAFGSDLMQRTMGLEYLPRAGKHAAVFV